MEALWVGLRAHLRHLLQFHPDWTGQQLADAVGCSRSMVYKWRLRFADASPDDVSVLFSRSRAPHRHPPRIDEHVPIKDAVVAINRLVWLAPSYHPCPHFPTSVDPDAWLKAIHGRTYAQ